jgi:peptidoglycan/LPS O-acetylase OafA/YrhL
LIDLLKNFTDPYERKARLTPGLLVVLPLLVPLVCVYGQKHPFLTAVSTLFFGCGAMYLLASVARGRGKKLEEKLAQKWGGMPTTIALRHRETSVIDSVSKQRYHDAIFAKLGIAMPTAAEEASDPARADETYLGATRRLRELTRGDKQLLLKENIAYGFHRNMLAMKDVGVVCSLLGLLYGLLIAKVVQLDPPAFTPANMADPGLAASLTLLVSVAMLAAWLFYFNADAVRRVGFTYAERLFEALAAMATPRKRAANKVTP